MEDRKMLRNEQASSWKKVNELNSGRNAERKQWTQFNRMEETKFSRTNKLLAARKQWTSIQQIEGKQMLTDEQASSWKKAIHSIQQNGRKEMLTDG